MTCCKTPHPVNRATLYGRSVQMDRCEALHWARAAALQGSEVGLYQLTFMSRLKYSPFGKDLCLARSY